MGTSGISQENSRCPIIRTSLRPTKGIPAALPALPTRIGPNTAGLWSPSGAALLQQSISVTIVDLVTTRNFNLYADLLDLIGQVDPALGAMPPSIYTATCRGTKPSDACLLETWWHPLQLGHPLPTMPLWLADDLAVPLELEASYEETCHVLRIP